MIAAISLFFIIFVSLLITRIATIALSHTGLSRETASFQARSALTGSGFTTSESEQVVNHPVRRKIIMLLMLIGNVGMVTAGSSLMLTFIIPNNTSSLISSIVIILLGIACTWWAAKSPLVDRFLSQIIDIALQRYTSLDLRDYSAILHLAGEYQISEIKVTAQHAMAHKTLKQLRLSTQGVLVLGIQRDKGPFIGTPQSATQILPNDTLTTYGKASAFAELEKTHSNASQ